MKLTREFYERNTLLVARDTLGKYLVHKSSEGKTIGKIVEVEAYIGPNDNASHAYKGLRTKRNEIQYGRGGYAYIYQIYGIYFCFNIVTEKIGKPEVVLIRALEPLQGIEIMAERRKINNLSLKEKRRLANGPGKLCIAMGINKNLYGENLCGDLLYIINDEEIISQKNIISTPRINIDYAGRSRSLPWRFLIANNKYVSIQ